MPYVDFQEVHQVVVSFHINPKKEEDSCYNFSTLTQERQVFNDLGKKLGNHNTSP